MKLFLLSLITLLFLSATPHEPSGGKKPVAAHRHTSRFNLPKPLATLGRCSGDAYCRSCSSCEYCGHCAGGGGTCGVCAPATTTRYTPTRHRSSTRARSVGSSISRPVPKQVLAPIEVTADYYISATTLNLRAAPTADSEVVRVLDRNDVVTVSEIVNDKWVKVSVGEAEDIVEGYVSRAYLSESQTF